jgi:tRNA(Ile)-lysidine synthetase-like protein
VAVSGGVDSMALLDMLVKQANSFEPVADSSKGDSENSHQPPAVSYKLIVAHFDHGIRPDSVEDRRLVQDIARRHGLPFVYDQGKLGPHSSEDEARQARYEFLHRVRQASGARAIVTAHHQDDLLETAIHNMLRGTGRRGLVSLRSRDYLHRPLLGMSKEALIAYAKGQSLAWREDSTNADVRYRRNYIRHKILPKVAAAQKKEELLHHIRTLQQTHDELEVLLSNYLHQQPAGHVLDRHWFIMLPHGVAREVLAAWLRANGISEFDSPTLERLIRAAKTFAPGKQADIDRSHTLHVDKYLLALGSRDR